VLAGHIGSEGQSGSVGQNGPNAAISGSEASNGVITMNGENEQSNSADSSPTTSKIISTFMPMLPNETRAVTSQDIHHEDRELTDLAQNNDLFRRHTNRGTTLTQYEVLHYITSIEKMLEAAGIIKRPTIEAAITIGNDILNVINDDDFYNVVCNVTDVIESVYDVIVEKLEGPEQVGIKDVTEIIMTLQDAANRGIKIVSSIDNNDFRKLINDTTNFIVSEFNNLDIKDLTDVIAILHAASTIGSKEINSVEKDGFLELSGDILNFILSEFKFPDEAGTTDETKAATTLQYAASSGTKLNSSINVYVHKLASIIAKNFKSTYPAAPEILKSIIIG
jgi:hypothetical protein